MKKSLLSKLQCPQCRTVDLRLVAAEELEGEVITGNLHCTACEQSYPITRHIPRFIEGEDYVRNFGFQWNRFRMTQLDTHSGTTISRERFASQTGWSPEILANAAVLDAGCGAGRFAEVALSMGAEVFAFDYSTAIDACWQTLGPHPRLHILQADIYKIPFKPCQFDFVYCFGVLQHTPEVRKAFMSLASQLKPGGKIAVDVYPKSWKSFLHVKNWLRPLTRRMRHEELFGLVEKCVPLFLPISRVLSKTPRIGRWLRYLLPIANYEGIYPLTEQQLREWAVLDTFDMLAPRFDLPQTRATLLAWFQEAGLGNVTVFKCGQLVGRGTRPF